MSRVVTFSLRGGLQRGDCTPCLGVRSKLIPTKIDPTLVVQAASVAAQWHSTQRRKGASQEPYINHLLEVAALVAAGGGDQPTVIAALLHDAIEDQKISPDTIAAQFGEYVAAIVLEVTDDKSLSKAERKAIQIATASHKSHSAKLIKLADKISNVRAVATSPPVSIGRNNGGASTSSSVPQSSTNVGAHRPFWNMNSTRQERGAFPAWRINGSSCLVRFCNLHCHPGQQHSMNPPPRFQRGPYQTGGAAGR
jgi:hypothetical protein